MTKIVSRETYQRWAGTVAELVDAANTAMESIDSMVPQSPTRGMGFRLDSEVSVWWKNRSKEGISIESFGAFPDRDLKGIKRVLISVTGVGASKLQSVLIDLNSIAQPSPSRDQIPGLTIEVVGQMETSVVGLLNRLKEVLGRGGSRISNAVYMIMWGLGGGFLLFLGRELGERVNWGDKLAWSLGVPWLIGLFAVMFIAPTIEVLPPGTRSRPKRFRALIYLALAGIPGSLIAAFIWSLFFE